MKQRFRKWLSRESTEIREFGFCIVGVVLFKALDISAQRFDLSALSLGYVAFAIGISLLLTVLTDTDTIPKDATPEVRRKIVKRVAKRGIAMGFAWQAALGKIQELIEL